VKRALAAAGVCLAASCANFPAADEGWQPIFDGRTLEGWTPKINHHALGENWRDTFLVRDGAIRVSYDGYGGKFADEYAHLIYTSPMSSYRLRLQYRFLGGSAPGVAAWAVRNSGVMLHGQAPETMALNQPYPVSVEAQLLGAAPGQVRTTGNVCTPGVTVAIAGVPLKDHCHDGAIQALQDGEWVTFEVEVHGGRLVRQFINGKLALDYSDIQLDPGEFKRFANIDAGDRKVEPLTKGHISLQGESSPVEFRRIEVKWLRD
jgi:hypothetical protein